MTPKEKKQYRELKLEKLRRLQLEEKMKEYRRQPLLWLSERLGEDPKNYKWSLYEGYEDHVWDGSKDPLSTAFESIANGQWTGIESGTGLGKTHLASRIILYFLDVYVGSTVVFLANSEKQLKMNLWKEIGKVFGKFKKLHPKSELLSLNLRMDNSSEKDPNSFGYEAIGLTTGVGADEESATKLQGIHAESLLFVAEELAGGHHAVIQAVKQTCVSDNNLILGIGNPDSETDELHKFCSLERVTHIRASSLDFPNVVLNKDIISGAVTRSSIEHRRNELGEESDLFKSRIRGISPAQSKDALISVDMFNQCVGHTPKTASYNAVGVDVARSKTGDKAAVAYGQSSVLTYIKEFQCPNASHLAYNLLYNDNAPIEIAMLNYNIPTIYEMDIQPQFIGIDTVGVGASVLDTFDNFGYNVTSLQGGQWVEGIPLNEKDLPYYRFISLRAQMYWEAKEDLRNMNVGIDIKDNVTLEKLRKELTTPKLVPSPSGIKVEEKEAIKKRIGNSPNLSDAFVYWNFTRKGYRITSSIDLSLGA